MSGPRIALPLGGTDEGTSGLGTWVRAVVPRLARRVDDLGGELVVLGTPTELEAYADVLAGVRSAPLPRWAQRPAVSAAWYVTRIDSMARRAGSELLLMPAANRRVAAGGGLPVVAVVHDLAQLHVSDKYDVLRMAYFRTVLLRSLRRADRIVAVSESTAADVRTVLGTARQGLPPVEVVPNGVDHERFSGAATNVPANAKRDGRDVEYEGAIDRARKSAGLPPGPYVLYLARLEHPGKNHVRLLSAFARSRTRRTHRLVLAGKDYGGRERIREEIARLGLEDEVRLVGYVEDAILPGLVAGSSAVAMVGLHEGFGLPALEALAAGRPVCASRTGALPEVVGPLGASCDPLSETSIGHALDLAVHDEVTRERARLEGPDRAAARGWEHTVEGLVAACDRALTQCPAQTVGAAR